jgi:hypothetical protein
MEAALSVLSGVIVVAIGLFINSLRDLSKRMKEGYDNTHGQCDKINDRQTVVETKLDIFMEHLGFDVNKVNRVIKEHMEELKKNDKPSVGCINIKELYKETGG